MSAMLESVQSKLTSYGIPPEQVNTLTLSSGSMGGGGPRGAMAPQNFLN